ncbi:hypothetical protein D1159_14730 [Pseudoflavonifractor sp. 524-17]|uniref:hypothetical protein n=1 Tax=Pseudoflavonifractor sp. 524-17 TaxID=2304577 RepID=UPI0013797F7C|nr:hypothetical protein [Pseudoflavonifractor sp. 524-17]NCE65797.1 hypothetical protein [Pseudoflavonifractor sp. 524-17]
MRKEESGLRGLRLLLLAEVLSLAVNLGGVFGLLDALFLMFGLLGMASVITMVVGLKLLSPVDPAYRTGFHLAILHLAGSFAANMGMMAIATEYTLVLFSAILALFTCVMQLLVVWQVCGATCRWIGTGRGEAVVARGQQVQMLYLVVSGVSALYNVLAVAVLWNAAALPGGVMGFLLTLSGVLAVAGLGLYAWFLYDSVQLLSGAEESEKIKKE